MEPRVLALLRALFALWVTVGVVRIAERGVRVEQLLLVSSCRSLDSCGIRHLRIPLPETSATLTRSDWSCRRSAGTRLAWQSQMCQERQASKLAGGDVKSDLSLGGGVQLRPCLESSRLPEPGPSRLPDRLPDDQRVLTNKPKPKKGGTQVPLVLKCSVASCPLRRVKPNLAVGNPLTKLPLNPDPARVTA